MSNLESGAFLSGFPLGKPEIFQEYLRAAGTVMDLLWAERTHFQVAVRERKAE